jgi:hypothetical protein
VRIGIEDTRKEVAPAEAEPFDALAPNAGTGRIGILVRVSYWRRRGCELNAEQRAVAKNIQFMGRCARSLRLESTRSIYMGKNTEAAERLHLGEAVEHAVAAMRVLRSAITDVDLTVKALQGVDCRQIAEQMTFGSGELDRGDYKQSQRTGSGNSGRDAADLVVIGYRDDFETLPRGGGDDGFRGGCDILNVMAAQVAVDMEVGPYKARAPG